MTYLEKAQRDYSDYVRGYRYQQELIDEWVYEDEGSIDELRYLRARKEMFFDRLIALENVFGANNLEY